MIKQYWLHFIIGLLGVFIGYACGRKDARHVEVREVSLSDEQAQMFAKLLGAFNEVNDTNRTEDKEE